MATQVYFDNAATTQIREEVIDRMAEVMRNTYGNASSTHSFGRSSKSLIEEVRKQIAAYFNEMRAAFCSNLQNHERTTLQASRELISSWASYPFNGSQWPKMARKGNGDGIAGSH